VPTYAYACTACDHRFEAQQAFTDDALTECPECTGRLRKLFSSVGIVFKGSGFYRTDSRTNGAGGGKSSIDAGSGSSSTESKSSSDSSGSSSSDSSGSSNSSGSSDSGSSAAAATSGSGSPGSTSGSGSAAPKKAASSGSTSAA